MKINTPNLSLGLVEYQFCTDLFTLHSYDAIILPRVILRWEKIGERGKEEEERKESMKAERSEKQSKRNVR